MAQRDAAGLHGHLVRHQAVQPGFSARASHFPLAERREVDDTDLLAQVAAFVADMFEVVAATEAELVLRLHAFRREPVGTLPAVTLAEHAAHLLDLVVHRARLRRTRVFTLFVGEVHGEHVAVGFFVLGHHVALAGVGAETTRVDGEHVDARLALGDPFRQLPARTASGGDAEAVAFVQPQAALAPGRADERAAVRGVGDGAVDDGLDAALFQRRHATLRRFDVRDEAFDFAVEQALAEPLGHAVREAGRGAALVGAQNPAAALFAQVVRLVRLAQHGQFLAAVLAVLDQLRRLVVDDVLVLDRDGRHVDAEHLAGLAGVVAGGAHHVFAGHFAAAGGELPLARGQLHGVGHFGLFVDFSATHACALAQRHGQVGRGDVAVVRVVQRADDVRRVAAIAQLHERPQALHFLGGDDAERHADGVGGAAVLQVFVHAVAVGGETQVAGDVEADVLAGFGGQVLVQVHRVLVELAHGVAHVEQRQQAGGVPGGAGGELGALQQGHVRPALLGQMVEGADADGASADDDDSVMALHANFSAAARIPDCATV